jgi:hypothetical protein
VILEKTFDPAFAVLVAPVIRPRIPQMRVAINHEDILPIMTAHDFIPPWSAASSQYSAWQAWRDRKTR